MCTPATKKVNIANTTTTTTDTNIIDLGPDVFDAIVNFIRKGDLMPFALASKAFLDLAVAKNGGHMKWRTNAFASPSMLKWAAGSLNFNGVLARETADGTLTITTVRVTRGIDWKYKRSILNKWTWHAMTYMRDVELVWWLLSNGAVSSLAERWVGIRTGDIKLLQSWKHDKWPQPLSFEMAKEGQIEAFRWALAQSPPLRLNAGMCRAAAQGGQLEMLQWLRAQGCSWSHYTCEAAVKNGHLGVLQWAHANGCELRYSMLRTAAWSGHLEVFRWLYVDCGLREPPLDAQVCMYAAKRGRLEILQWLRAQSPPYEWDARTVAVALDKGHHAVVEWARANGCPG